VAYGTFDHKRIHELKRDFLTFCESLIIFWLLLIVAVSRYYLRANPETPLPFSHLLATSIEGFFRLGHSDQWSAFVPIRVTRAPSTTLKNRKNICQSLIPAFGPNDAKKNSLTKNLIDMQIFILKSKRKNKKKDGTLTLGSTVKTPFFKAKKCYL